ncbi:MAG: chitobiase/beta-hexosaminidase C-terminal domain-containing protein [Fibrobacteres bacterium]|nr:chitobiase/beta-hexosaminidase C-terminal domain-containing protein [Fibrobacterota bacterium]
MSNRYWPKAWRAAVPLAALASILSCQTTTVVEEDLPATAGDHYVHFRVADSSTIPDSLWYKSPLDSGTHSFMVEGANLTVRLWPFLNQLGDKDTLAIHTYRLGLHLGVTIAKSAGYMDLLGVRTVRSGADSLAVSLLRTFDSLRKATPGAFKDTSAAGKRAALQQTVAEFVFRGHPSAATYKRLAPTGLDTAKVNRQILTLAAKSGLTLGEVVKQWNLAMDYASARQLVAALSVDSSSLNPFQLETALRLDTLRPGEPPVGLLGKIKGKKGVKSIEYVIEGDSGVRTDRFVLADFPDLNANPESIDLAGHPTFAPRANAVQGAYTLRLLVKDALGNEQVYTTAFQVGAELDHKGPSLIVLSPTSAVVRDFNDSQLVVKVDAKDPSGVKSVTIDGKVADKGEDGIWFDTLVVPVRDSSQLVKIEAKDVFGNASDAQIQIRRNQKPIPTAPRLKLVSPASGTLVAFEDSVVRVVWKAETDFGEIDSVTIDGVQAKPESGTWVRDLTLPANGKTTSFGVRAYSSVPLTATEYVSIGRKADNAGPVVVWNDAAKSQRAAYDIKQTEISVTASDLSGVDSVRIGGSKVNPLNKEWKATVLLAGPGELTRILVEAWDHAGNLTDTELVVARDQIPGELPPQYRWLKPVDATGTVIPFTETNVLVQCVLTDISGMDSSSVKIGGELAKPINDSVWERSVGLPPNGNAQVITLEAKNKRGVPVSGFVSVARAKDAEKPSSTRWAATKDASVAWDTTSVEVGWIAKDNDRIAQAWIQDSLLTVDATGYHRLVPLAITTQWVKFRAVDPAGNEVRDSVQIERRPDTVKTVTLSDSNGKLRSGTFWVKLSCATPGATIRYTLNGSDPTSTSPIFSDSIKIDTTTTLKARAFGKERMDGPLVTQLYKMAVPVVVSTGGKHTLVLMSDGTLWGMGDSWGNAFSSDSACTQGTCILPPTKIAEDVAQIAAGSGYSMWVKNDGTLWAIGYNRSGALGIGSFENRAVPTMVMQGVTKVTTHYDGRDAVTMVIKKDGSLWGAGSCLDLGSATGCVGQGHSDYSIAFKRLASDVVDATLSKKAMFLTSDGVVWRVTDSVPVRLADSVLALAARNFGGTYLLLKKTNAVWGAGNNNSGQLGNEGIGGVVDETVRQIDASKKWISVLEGESLSLMLSEGKQLFGMGSNYSGAMGIADYLGHPVPELIASDVIQFDAWSGSLFYIRGDHTLWGLANNYSGELGQGHTNEVKQVTRIRF